MGRDEQKEEREVLESIFPDEIQDISDTEYRVIINLEVKSESEEEEEPPAIVLNVRYPDAYPDVPPDLDIMNSPTAPRHEHLDVAEDKARMLDALQETIAESMGMAMVFTLVSTVKDAAELLIAERQQAVQALKDVEAAEAEAEDNRKFEGAKVTRESFLAWREEFQREMAEAKAARAAQIEAEEKKRRGKAEEKKLTGKQLWEQGLAGKTVEEDEEGEDVVGDMRALKVDG